MTTQLLIYETAVPVSSGRHGKSAIEPGKGYAFVGPSYDDVKYFGVGSGVGLRKADEKVLGKKFNDAIAAVKANGTFKKLNDKYFEYDISGKTAK